MEGSIVVIAVVVIVIVALAIWHSKKMELEEDKAFPALPPTPLTFNSMVGAIVLGNVLTAILGAICWFILIRESGL